MSKRQKRAEALVVNGYNSTSFKSNNTVRLDLYQQQKPPQTSTAGAGRGSVNPPVVDTKASVPPARTADPGWGKDDYKPLIPDTSKGPFKKAVVDPEGVKEAGSLTGKMITLAGLPICKAVGVWQRVFGRYPCNRHRPSRTC